MEKDMWDKRMEERRRDPLWRLRREAKDFMRDLERWWKRHVDEPRKRKSFVWPENIQESKLCAMEARGGYATRDYSFNSTDAVVFCGTKCNEWAKYETGPGADSGCC